MRKEFILVVEYDETRTNKNGRLYSLTLKPASGESYSQSMIQTSKRTLSEAIGWLLDKVMAANKLL